MVFFRNNNLMTDNKGNLDLDYNMSFLNHKTKNNNLNISGNDNHKKIQNQLSIQNEETHYLNSDLNSFINSSEYAEDIDIIEERKKENSKNYETLMLNALEEEKHSRYNDALKIYNIILEQNPNCKNINVYKGKVINLANLEKFEEAFNFINNVMNKIFSKNEILNIKSQIYFIQKDYLNSLNIINQLLKDEESNEIILSNKLRILYNLKEIKKDDLMNCLNKLLKINKNNSTALFYSGKLYQDKFKYEKAINNYLKSIEKNNKLEEEVYENLGICYQNIKKYKSALFYYEKYSIYKPKEKNFFNMGLCSFELQLYNKSNEYFSMCIELNPNNFESIFYKGLSNLKLLNDKKAERQFLKVIQINPFFYEAYINLIQLHLSKFKYDDALNIIKTAKKNLKKENDNDKKIQFLIELEKYELKIKSEKEDDKKNQCSCQGCNIF